MYQLSFLASPPALRLTRAPKDWSKYPPLAAGQRRVINGKEGMPARKCVSCEEPFWPHKARVVHCPDCMANRWVCPECGGPKGKQAKLCRKCSYENLSEAQMSQLKNLHANMTGDSNPAKRPEVAAKISKAISGKNHPSRLYPEKWKKQGLLLAQSRPEKVSELEEVVAEWLPDFSRQHRVKWYRLDFADPERMIAVEVQGCWYHSCPKCGYKTESRIQKQNAKNDKSKRTYLTNRGWTVLYLWGHQIREAIEDGRAMTLEEIESVQDQ